MSDIDTCFQFLTERSAAYSLPWLIKLKGKDENNDDWELLFVNNNDAITFEGETYQASSFSYIPNADMHGFTGGGVLEIENNFDLFSQSEYTTGNNNVEFEAVGVIVNTTFNSSGVAGYDIHKLDSFKHKYGKLSGSRKKLKYSFETDDRLNMTFPALIFNGSNNAGNK